MSDDLLLPNPRVFAKAAGDDQCNICEQHAPLTDDHVPPRSCLVERRYKIQRYFYTTQHPIKERRPALSQNGVAYRTLCGTCNSTLGAKYDPALADFAAAVRARLTSVLTLPPIVYCKPAEVMHAVCGHILAAKTKIDGFTMDQDLRPFVLDPAAIAPRRWRVFYWVYPHRHIAVMRDIAMPSVRGVFNSGGAVFSIVKFFPLGFLITDLRGYEGLPCLNDFARGPTGSLAKVPITRSLGRSLRWPEECVPGNFVMGGPALNDSFGAFFAPRGT